MDIEHGDRSPICHVTEDDLQELFAGELQSPLALVRNYGDRLEAKATGDGKFRLAYYEAVTGRWHEADAPLTRDQVKDAFVDYFQGNWNWHQRCTWRKM